MLRKNGFYWVRYLGDMTVGQWDEENEEWYLVGLQKENHHITDKDLDYIALQVG